MNIDYFKEFNVAVTICDNNGIIVYMNDKSKMTFQKHTGDTLIGQSIFDCHPEKAAAKIRELLRTKKSNTYTIRKKNVRKLIHQLPWYENNECRGLVELSVEIPETLPEYIRD